MPPNREFERELEELGAGIEYPPTPDLARAVGRRLDEEGANTGTRGFWSRLPNLRWSAAAFLLIIAVPALSPALRAHIDEWLAAPQSASSGSEAARGDGQDVRSDVPSCSLAGSGEDLPESGGGAPSAKPEAGGERSLGKGLSISERVSPSRRRGPGLQADSYCPGRQRSASRMRSTRRGHPRRTALRSSTGPGPGFHLSATRG